MREANENVMGHMTEWMWIGMGFMALFWIVAIVLGVWASRHARSRPSGKALHILEERFARGEIDQEGFSRRRETMGR